MAHARTERIDKAIEYAKIRDKHKCRICGKGQHTNHVIVGAHLLVRNIAYPWYHADDYDWIITLCWNHHKLFDRNHNAEARAQWLYERNLKNEASMIRKGLNGELHNQ